MSLMFLSLRLIPVPVQAVVLSTVLDLFFSRDDSLTPLLKGLEGRVFRIYVRDMNTIFYMGFRAGRPWVHASFDGDADVRIDATTAGFSRLCFAHEDPDDLIFQQVLKLSGDSEAMLYFKKLLLAADIDWERELRAGFGEYFGRRVARAAKVLIAADAKVSSASHETVRRCLKQMGIPDRKRFEAWLVGVEDMSHKTSCMKARMTRLEQAVQTRPSAVKST